MASEMLADVGSGKMHASAVVKYARLHKAGDSDMELLASLGDSNFSNVERDLHRLMSCAYPVQPFIIPVTLYDEWGYIHQSELPTVAPYELFAALMSCKLHDRPDRGLLGQYGEIGPSYYWGNAIQSEWGRSHPASLPPLLEFRNKIIPLAVHADGVECYSSTEFHVFSWSSCLCHSGKVDDERHLICATDEARMVPGHTYDEIVNFMKWNFEVTASGMYPACDHLGRPLPAERARLAHKPLCTAGWRAIFTTWLGDLKERVYAHRFSRNYRISKVCNICNLSPLAAPLRCSGPVGLAPYPSFVVPGLSADHRSHRTEVLFTCEVRSFTCRAGGGKGAIYIYIAHRRTNFICEFCLANRHLTVCCPYDFRPNAEWTRHRTDHRTYLLTTGIFDRSPYAEVPGWTIFRNKLDNLHACFLGFGDRRELID